MVWAPLDEPTYPESENRPGVMTLSASPVAADTAKSFFHALSQLRFPPGLRLTPEQFVLLCAENREAVLELAADGRVLAMTPTGSETGGRNSVLSFQLQRFARLGTTWKAFDSSSGFRLPDASVLSPDASLVRLDRWQALTPEQRRGFAPLCPDLVVELASPSDEGPRDLTALRSKLFVYQSNGARLGWLLIPHQQAVEVWPESGDPQRFEGLAVLEAGPEFPALQLQLDEIWAG
jgi:Uma2 family endonuclease